MSKVKVTILGSGTSQGVPVIACNCSVCLSKDEKDKRLRSSIRIEVDGLSLVVDSGPDFRQQMLRAKVNQLDAIIYTHEHKDHIAGMDDVRAYNYMQKRDMDLYVDHRVEKALKREFYYAFEDTAYPGAPKVNLHIIENKPFTIGSTEITPVEVLHFKLPVFGYRIYDFAYITDAKTVANAEREKLKGLKVLIINALRLKEHISHFNLEEALEFIREVNPEKAYITHISHLFGTHKEIEELLPENVYACFDGMVIDID